MYSYIVQDTKHHNWFDLWQLVFIYERFYSLIIETIQKNINNLHITEIVLK